MESGQKKESGNERNFLLDLDLEYYKNGTGALQSKELRRHKFPSVMTQRMKNSSTFSLSLPFFFLTRKGKRKSRILVRQGYYR